MENLLNEIQPYLSLITTLLSITVLGFIINLALLIRHSYSARAEALIDQKGVVEERLKNSEENLERTEKWYQREITRLKEELSTVLNKGNITIDRLAANISLTNIKNDIKEVLDKLLKEMKSLEMGFKNDKDKEVSDPNWYLEMAKGFSASDKWLEAAKHYDKYIEYDNANFEIHFLRAVAYANSRIDYNTNLLALKSYNEAISLIPKNINKNYFARLYTYRGAIFKRLGRLDEAENDLIFAKKFATETYEVNDIKYNLSCIYSMKNDKEKLFQLLKELRRDYINLSAIYAHIDDYFINFANDKEFLRLINKA